MEVWILVVAVIISQLSISASMPEAVINPHDFNYIIKNKDYCGKEPIDIFIWVHSGPANVRRRIALRETWANPAMMPPGVKSKMIFFLGAINNSSTQSLVEFEHQHYGDIVQEDYLDSYRNLTYKAMSGLKWLNRYCKNVKLILKCDDDMVILMDKLFNHLKSVTGFPLKPVVNTIICDVWSNRPVERAGGMKWTVSKEEYSADKYPTYCPGLALLMSPDLVKVLWEKSLNTKYFWVDDVFFTGLLVERLNVTWVQTGSLFHFGGETLSKTFSKAPGDFIFAHVFSYRTDLFYYLWRTVFPSQDFIY